MQATRLYTILFASFCFSAITLLRGTSSIATAQAITHVPLYTFHGDRVADGFGRSVSGAGDVNGDGTPDLIVGAPDNFLNQSNGSARVFSGNDGSVLYTFNGDSLSDRFGSSVSGAGDVNGDGTPDLIVGAISDDNNGASSGSARVFSGSDGSVLYNFDGDSVGDLFGSSVSGAGDVNGDGTPDLIAGAPFNRDNGFESGIARVLSGSDGSPLYTFSGNGSYMLGASVSGAGDVNGDGFADLIVGAERAGGTAGHARVLSGSDGSVLYSFDGDSRSEFFGSSVSGAGDVNGDGTPDLIVGSRNDDNNGSGSGSARVFSGSDGSVLYNFNGDNEFDSLGSSVSGAGDVNGDGTPDLIVGAPNDNGVGSVRVFSGVDGSILYTFNGDSERDGFGWSVSGAGDLNGDGFDDFIVGTFVRGIGFGYARVFVSQSTNPSSLSIAAEAGSQLTQGSFSVTNHPLSSVTEFQILHSDVFTDPVTIDAQFVDLANAQANPLYENSDTSILRSDIVELTGLDGLLHVVDLSIDSTVGTGELVWLTDDGTSRWINAVLGNRNISGLELDPAVELGDTPLVADDVQTTVAAYLDSRRFDGSYDDYLASIDGLEPELGAFGSTTGRAWAVIDHNSSFAVAEVAVVEVLLGDVNLDGAVDFADIPAFIDVLISGISRAEADCNEDGSVDFADIPVFISILIGQ